MRPICRKIETTGQKYNGLPYSPIPQGGHKETPTAVRHFGMVLRLRPSALKATSLDLRQRP